MGAGVHFNVSNGNVKQHFSNEPMQWDVATSSDAEKEHFANTTYRVATSLQGVSGPLPAPICYTEWLPTILVIRSLPHIGLQWCRDVYYQALIMFNLS